MSAHTPGPWLSVQVEFGNIYAMTNASNDYIRVDTGNPANARLIAAAPDLLNVLETILRQIKTSSYIFHNSDELRAVLAAIAKATGEPA